jgi:hypothetical protein
MKFQLCLQPTPRVLEIEPDNLPGLAAYFLRKCADHLEETDDCDHTHCEMRDPDGNVVVTMECDES